MAVANPEAERKEARQARDLQRRTNGLLTGWSSQELEHLKVAK